MSDTAIADVGATLLRLLRDNMGDLIAPASIVLLSPGDVQDPNVRLSIFLYSVIENAQLKNEEPILNLNSFKFPPLLVDLYYLLTAYASNQFPDQTEQTLEQHRILGRAMRILYDNSILGGSILQGSMAGTAQELRIVANPISLDDLNQIWSTFRDLGYRLSISYLITPVRIDSVRELGMQRVVSKEMNYLSAGRQE
jgi:hypothetical protein